MNLSELQIKPALRGKWEAIDVGILMAKRWFWPLLAAWAVPAMTVFLILSAIFHESPWIAMLVFWWLKPLFDRLPLYLLSRYLFNEPVPQLFNARVLIDIYRFDIFSALTWRRFEFRRSFNLPITVLEKQKGQARAKRAALMQFGCGNAATWVTTVFIHFEILLCLGFISLVALFIPSNTDWDFLNTIMEHPLIFEHLYNLIYASSVCIIAPLYIASGFSLYINRRVELEAWDLELLFRDSMLKRQKNTPKAASTNNIASHLALFCCLSFSLISTDNLNAAQNELNLHFDQTSQEAEQSKEQMLEIIESPPFVIEKEVTQWEWKSNNDTEESAPELPEWLESIEHLFELSDVMKSISVFFEVIIWGSIALLLLFIAKHILRNLDLSAATVGRKKEEISNPKPSVIMGLNIETDSLPEDITEAVEKAVAEGNHRHALSLLYRFSLNLLINRYDLHLEDWFTEQECANAVKHSLEEDINRFFSALTRTWQLQAYAHLSPTDDAVLTLSGDLKKVFDL